MKRSAERFACLLALALALAGCATGNNPSDPFEGFNRSMFTFNDTVDRVALKPVATAYRDTLPSFVQTGIYNFFSNIGDVWTAVNNFLQGKGGDGIEDVMRVSINTVLGFGGVLDIASEAGLTRHKQDFGTTLGVWGVESGPYLVLPFLGASTVRDTAVLPIEFAGDLWQYTTPVATRNIGSVVRVVDLRAGVLDASNLIESAALDKYEFIRDAFLQRRAGKIGGGKTPESEDEAPKPAPKSSAVVPMSTPLSGEYATSRNGEKELESVSVIQLPEINERASSEAPATPAATVSFFTLDQQLTSLAK